MARCSANCSRHKLYRTERPRRRSVARDVPGDEPQVFQDAQVAMQGRLSNPVEASISPSGRPLPPAGGRGSLLMAHDPILLVDTSQALVLARLAQWPVYSPEGASSSTKDQQSPRRITGRPAC